MGDWSCGAVFGRVAHLLPCGSWLCFDGVDFDEDARLILTAPEPALAECLIPPSAALLYEERGRGSSEAEPSAASWNPGAARPGAIELKEAAQNPMLGQYHLGAGGRFVSTKVAPAQDTMRRGSEAAAAHNGIDPRVHDAREDPSMDPSSVEGSDHLDWDADESGAEGSELGPPRGVGSGLGADSVQHRQAHGRRWQPPEESPARSGQADAWQ